MYQFSAKARISRFCLAVSKLIWMWIRKVMFVLLNLSYIYLGYFVCVSVIHNCGTLCYSFSFNNQTDQRDETEGLKREGLEGER